MFGWWIILILLGVNVVGLIANLRFLYWYMHEDDLKYNQGIFAQIVVVFGLQLLLLILCIVPTDAYNTLYSTKFNMLYFWQLAYLFLLILVTAPLPYANFYYEADSDPRIAKTPPWRSAIYMSVITCGICWGVMGLLYAIGRKAHFEVDGVERNVTFAFLTYLVAVPGFFGWIVFVFQGGVGLVYLPLSLIMSFVYRPRALSSQEYEAHKILVGERAALLHRVGEKLKDKDRAITEGEGGLARSSQRLALRRKINHYKQVVDLLNNEYTMLETSFNKRGINPVLSYLNLILGISASCISLLWYIIITFSLIVPQIASLEPIPILDPIMKGLSKSRILIPEIAIYLLLTLYLCAASIAGSIRISNTKIGTIFPVEPLRKGNTHLNAMLFHMAMTLLCGTAIVQLSISVMNDYLLDTEAQTLFDMQRDNMKIFSPFYSQNVFAWALLVISLLSGLYMGVRKERGTNYELDSPKVMAQWAALQKELGIDKHEAGAVTKPTHIPVEEPDKGLSDYARNKFADLDQGITQAPKQLLGAGMRQAWS